MALEPCSSGFGFSVSEAVSKLVDTTFYLLIEGFDDVPISVFFVTKPRSVPEEYRSELRARIEAKHGVIDVVFLEEFGGQIEILFSFCVSKSLPQ